MEKRRSPLVSIPPLGRGFSRHAGLSSDDSFWSSVCSAREEHPALLDIGSMSPPDYPSAWLHPCRARLRFARQDHCSSVTACRCYPRRVWGLRSFTQLLARLPLVLLAEALTG